MLSMWTSKENYKMVIPFIPNLKLNKLNTEFVLSVYLSTGFPSERRPRRRLVVTGDSARYRTKLLRILPGSLTCLAYSTVTWDLGLTSHPKDN